MNNRIDIRFKVRFTEVEDDQTWHTPHVPLNRWQKCYTAGHNIVWNDLDKFDKALVGDEKYICALWRENTIGDEDRFKYHAHIEPRFYVDSNQEEEKKA